MRNRILILLVIFVAGVVAGYFVVNKPHRNIMSEEAIYEGGISELRSAYNNNPELFDSLYTDKAAIIEGFITSIETKNFMIDNLVKCIPDSTVDVSGFSRGQQVKMKGRIVGVQDGILGIEISLDQARPISQ